MQTNINNFIKIILIVISITIVLFALYVVIGGWCVESLHNLLIGDVDISSTNTVSYRFKSPGSSTLNFSIEVLDQSGPFESTKLGSDLVFSITIKDVSNLIYQQRFSKNNLSIGNWHDPNTSIIAMPVGYRSILAKSLRKGKEYELIIDVIEPDNIYQKHEARFYINYLDSSWSNILEK
ncbi:hypothetical protein ACFL2Y_04985 [Candidatus Omnitrophota bacterium]